MTDFPRFYPGQNFKFVVGELSQTTMTLVRYEAGEIFRIRNTPAGTFYSLYDERVDELESRAYREQEVERTSETSETTTSQSTMRDAAQSLQAKSQTINLGTEASGTYGAVSFSAYGDVGLTQSTQRSSQTAREVSDQLVRESREKTKTRILNSLSTRALTVHTKRSEAGIDNRSGDHSVAVTRLVNEIHRIDLLQHAKHMFANIVIANPAAHYRDYMENDPTAPSQTNATTRPVLERDGTVITAADLNTDNWLDHSAYFGVEDALPPPDPVVSVSGSIDFQSPKRPSVGHDAIMTKVRIPEGYAARRARVAIASVSHDSKIRTRFYLSGRGYDLKKASPAQYVFELADNITDSDVLPPMAEGGGELDVGFTASNAYESGVTFTIECDLLQTSYELWQFDLYRLLLEAQNKGGEQSVFDAASAIGVDKVDLSNSPILQRQLIAHETRRVVSQRILGADFNGFSVLDMAGTPAGDYPLIDHDKLDRLSPIVQFIDTVFDYDKMSVRYVDNFIGDRDKRTMPYEGRRPGPLKDFMESTFVRVILPIARFGDNELKLRWFQETGEVFAGDDVPVFDDELSLAILDELIPAGVPDPDDTDLISSEEITLPSPHTILQSDATLPDFEADSQPALVTETRPQGSSAPTD
ncbi:hypothetical protein ACFFUB_07255 [Algimonas porphyrae]|uniref:Uncharacterized protein n=1 Tax=Algimonas porphyrae TaxID=1128113 RepID=A0ABQ5V436_9PROT|nr:hypothetical protein [Algimonas porphyrae]GLQ21037.1 hypothetical protein GCM10007854_19920 [Algimonas porphyrae]